MKPNFSSFYGHLFKNLESCRQWEELMISTVLQQIIEKDFTKIKQKKSQHYGTFNIFKRRSQY